MKPAIATTAQTPNPAIGLAETRVLVIDNDPQVVEAMQDLLGRWSCDVRSARDLTDVEGLISRADFRPEIILADYHLDYGTLGTAAITRLRNSFGSRLPAIVITADRSSEIAAATRALSCEILHKPVRPAELRALMQHLLN